jgi:hypothetical protein
LASVTVDGTLGAGEGYGSALATQTDLSGFGYSTSGDGTSSGGSELDAGYGVVQNGTLYLFLAGNIEDNGTANHLNVFIADNATPGQSVLNVSGGWTASAMNGSVFGPDFSPSLLLDANDYYGTLYVDQYNLNPSGSNNSYLGGIGLSGGIGNNQNLSGIAVGFNNTNISTMGTNGLALADNVTTGLELGIPLSALGNPTGNIQVLADINGGGDGYLSNQFLPGLAPGTGNLGGPPIFNFGGVYGQYFSVAVPEPTSIGLVGAAAMMLCARRRKA